MTTEQNKKITMHGQCVVCGCRRFRFGSDGEVECIHCAGVKISEEENKEESANNGQFGVGA